MTHEVVFEKKIGDAWEPTRSDDFKTGDIVRMRQTDGSILGSEGVVCGKNATDPDSKVSFSLGLDFVMGG